MKKKKFADRNMAHIEALVKPHMLKWIREKSGFDLFRAAKRIGINPERLKEWEEGTRKPTIKQAIKMAEIYKRPLSLFYLNEPPKDFQVAMKDFRTLPSRLPGTYSPALLLEHRSAVSRRNLVMDLPGDSTTGNFSFLGSISLQRDPEQGKTYAGKMEKSRPYPPAFRLVMRHCCAAY